MKLTRTPLLLEGVSDDIRRHEQAIARSPNDAAAHGQLAAARLRRGDDPLEVSSNLYHSAPEAHADLRRSTSRDHPHHAALSVAPIVADFEKHRTAQVEADREISAAGGVMTPATRHKLGRAGAMGVGAWSKVEKAAQVLDRPVHELLGPRPGENPAQHRERLVHSLVLGNSPLFGGVRSATQRNADGQEVHTIRGLLLGSATSSARVALDALRHWYGQTHHVDTIGVRPGQFRIQVTAKKARP